MYNTIQKLLEEGDFLTVVCTGDAQTAQLPVKPGWTDWLQRALWENGDSQKNWRRRVFNTAAENATPRHIATYIRSYVSALKPDVIIASFGIAPFLPQYDEATFLAELDAFCDALLRLSTPVVLWSPYPLSGGIARDASLSVTRIFEQRCSQLQWQFVDVFHQFDSYEMGKFFTLQVGPKSTFGMIPGGNDHIHIGVDGQYIIAKTIAQEVFRLGLSLESVGSFVVPNLESAKRWT